ncbi:hypothetical protein [Reichenbachiella sp. MSK19-1]|uniref:hypothetical protein n=1 Tax=Reichenbachiella sp. MSK19-1 TaxID=1897631 RepID=UPI0011C46625|nr:hypothetical protein [Reichenbachiella sp. MSK19-1]
MGEHRGGATAPLLVVGGGAPSGVLLPRPGRAMTMVLCFDNGRLGIEFDVPTNKFMGYDNTSYDVWYCTP